MLSILLILKTEHSSSAYSVSYPLWSWAKT